MSDCDQIAYSVGETKFVNNGSIKKLTILSAICADAKKRVFLFMQVLTLDVRAK